LPSCPIIRYVKKCENHNMSNSSCALRAG
jgi:hypothetical protein